jgi:3-phenylpropionate/trans-cinnamate dioxygenase ferredoxin reductase subunit
MTTAEQTFLIVGGGLAGAGAAEALRSEGFTGRVVLLGEETERPYNRPPLSKDYLQGKSEKDKIYVHPAGWYAEHDVELKLGARVATVDRAAHELGIDGGDRIRYDSCCWPPVPPLGG